jgi:hypothetical protein
VVCWISHEGRSVLTDKALHPTMCQREIEGHVATKALGIDADPSIAGTGHSLDRIPVVCHELAHHVAAIFRHNEHVISPTVHLLSEFGEDVGMTSRSQGNDDAGPVVSPVEAQKREPIAP